MREGISTKERAGQEESVNAGTAREAAYRWASNKFQAEMVWREGQKVPGKGSVRVVRGGCEGVVGTPRIEEINKGSATTGVEGDAAGNQPPQTFHCEAKP